MTISSATRRGLAVPLLAVLAGSPAGAVGLAVAAEGRPHVVAHLRLFAYVTERVATHGRQFP